MNIGLVIPSAAPAAAPTSSSQLVDQGQVAQPDQRETFSALFTNIAQTLLEETATLDIEPLIPSADSLAAPTNQNVVADISRFAQGETTSTLSKVLAQSIPDEKVAAHSEPGASTDSIPLSDAGTQSPLASMMGFSLATDAAEQGVPEVISAEAGRAELVQIAQSFTAQEVEVLAVAPQSMRVAQTYQSDATSAAPTDLAARQVLQPLADPGLPGVASTQVPKQTAVGTTNESPVRDGLGAPVDPVPALLERRSGDSTLFSSPLPGLSGSDRWPSSVMDQQGTRNVLASPDGNVGAQSPDRLSTMIQTQGTKEAAPLQSLALSAIGVSGGREQNPFGTDAEGAGEGDVFRSGESHTQESPTRDNQSLLFNGQFGSARQAQVQPQGAGVSAAMTADDHLKLAQAFFGEDHSATMTSATGKAQTVHVELPLHDSGPLSVRISMTDQTVHTQFTTDRNDLGALLLTRQDQLQQTLIKSGLELGQFQVHIDQRGQQEMLSDRQPRRHGESPEQQPASPDHNQQAQDRERSNHRPARTLSLFA